MSIYKLLSLFDTLSNCVEMSSHLLKQSTFVFRVNIMICLFLPPDSLKQRLIINKKWPHQILVFLCSFLCVIGFTFFISELQEFTSNEYNNNNVFVTFK